MGNNQDINNKKNHFTKGSDRSLNQRMIDIRDFQNEFDVADISAFEDNPAIKGFSYEDAFVKTAKGELLFDLGKFISGYAHTGFQASNLAQGVEICKIMRREGATIFLSFTSNMVSSGCREAISYLVKHKLVDVLVTSAGAIEEDVIKCMKPFRLGSFSAPGRYLFEKGVNRTGNLYVPNDRYAAFDQFMQPVLKHLYHEQKHNGVIWAPHMIIKRLGEIVGSGLVNESGEQVLSTLENHESSVLYWAAQNEVPIYCPGLIDGSFGDMIVYFKQQHSDFILDTAQEMYSIVRLVMNCENDTGLIALGGGISKHFALNANIFREGFNYAVYINTAQEFDGSDSGARPDEAITWGKLRVDSLNVKVVCDATIAFPLLVAGAFALDKKD